jgi:hypothetical protein
MDSSSSLQEMLPQNEAAAVLPAARCLNNAPLHLLPASLMLTECITCRLLGYQNVCKLLAVSLLELSNTF